MTGCAAGWCPFPVAAGNYAGLRAASGKVFWLSSPTGTLTDEEPPKASLRLYDLEKRKEVEVAGNLQGYDLSPDHAKVLVYDGKDYAILEPKEAAAKERTLDLAGLRMQLDPRAEWAQIFREACAHPARLLLPARTWGEIDWPAMRRRYEALLPYVSHRADLTYLLGRARGGAGLRTLLRGRRRPAAAREAPVGVLGAELRSTGRREPGASRASIPGESWTEERRSPLLNEPGVKVEEGEYLLAIDGNDLTPADEPYRLLLGKADGW